MRRYSFKPKIIPTLATILLLPGLIGLGFWQLQRAKQKRELLAMYDVRLNAVAQPISKLKMDLTQVNFLPVEVKGEFDNQRNILLNNRYHNHVLGYQVLTPLFIKETGKAILINRGWIPRGESHPHLPKIVPVEDIQVLKGYAKIPDKNIFTLSHKQDDEQWPREVQQIKLSEISRQLGVELYPFILLLAPDQAHGFERDWNPVVVNPAKHTGYAVQWFSLAGLLIIIYVGVNLRRKELQDADEN